MNSLLIYLWDLETARPREQPWNRCARSSRDPRTANEAGILLITKLLRIYLEIVLERPRRLPPSTVELATVFHFAAAWYELLQAEPALTRPRGEILVDGLKTLGTGAKTSAEGVARAALVGETGRVTVRVIG